MTNPPEDELLRACLRLAIAGDDCRPFVAGCLRANGLEVPAEFDEALRRNARRVLVLTTELGRLVRALDAAGIETVAIKGPVLAHTVYPDPAWREFTDLDLLVPRVRFSATREVLARCGYRPAGRPLFLWWHTELHLIHETTGICVDLHWALLPRAYPASLTPTTFRTVTLDGFSVRTLSDADNLRYLCLHAAKHETKNPGWTLDMCLLSGQTEPPAPPVFALWRRALYRVSLVFIPTEADWTSLRLPGLLVFLYFPWRLLRLVRKRF